MVGATGFEPATTCTPSKCATRLRYAPARSNGGSVVTPAPAGVNASGRLVERVLQDLRGPERQHAPSGDFDLLSRLRIAANARLLLAHDEVAEPGELDLFAALQRVLQRVENHLDDLGGLLLGETDLAANAVDDVRLCHGTTGHGQSQIGQTTRGKPSSYPYDAARNRSA